jgi:glutathione S-transferase
METLTFANPAFSAYAIAAALMVLKMMGMAWLTVYRMVKVRAGFRSPEDEKKGPLNPEPVAGQHGPNDYVDRIRRIHQNDMENVPLFLVAGLLYVMTQPSATLAMALFGTYVISRLLHFVAYLTAQLHEVRATFWTIGALIVMWMVGAVLVHAVSV